MWACPSPAPVYGCTWWNQRKPGRRHNRSNCSENIFLTLFLLYFWSYFTISHSFCLSQKSWLMLWIQLSNFFSCEALQESVLSTTPLRRLILCLAVMHVHARTWKRNGCWIPHSLLVRDRLQDCLHHDHQISALWNMWVGAWRCFERGILGFHMFCFWGSIWKMRRDFYLLLLAGCFLPPTGRVLGWNLDLEAKCNGLRHHPLSWMCLRGLFLQLALSSS